MFVRGHHMDDIPSWAVERALFHKNDLRRILELAGEEKSAACFDDTNGTVPDFTAVHENEMLPICTQARQRIRKVQEDLTRQAEVANRVELETGLFENDQ